MLVIFLHYGGQVTLFCDQFLIHKTATRPQGQRHPEDWQRSLDLELWPSCTQDREQSLASEREDTQLCWLGREKAGPSIRTMLVAAKAALVTGAFSDDSQVDLKASP